MCQFVGFSHFAGVKKLRHSSNVPWHPPYLLNMRSFCYQNSNCGSEIARLKQSFFFLMQFNHLLPLNSSSITQELKIQLSEKVWPDSICRHKSLDRNIRKRHTCCSWKKKIKPVITRNRKGGSSISPASWGKPNHRRKARTFLLLTPVFCLSFGFHEDLRREAHEEGQISNRW